MAVNRRFAWPVLALAASLALLGASPASAQTRDVVVRVVDVGPGLCVLATIPGGHDFLYDGGHWRGSGCRRAVSEMVTDGVLDLLVISHPDGDHLGEVPAILEDVEVRRIVHTGRDGTSGAWRDAMAAVERERVAGASVIDLGTSAIAPGTVFALGPASATFVAGWHDWDRTQSDGPLSPGERQNVISIVMRLDYRGRSILLTGDTIGRGIGDPPSDCDHAERWMVRHQPARLRADVLVAPHHGGDNGSSGCFVEAVRPGIVIFSAGHQHHHPTAAAAARYLALTPRPRIYRTDFGDDEGAREWEHGRRPGCTDRSGDDDLEIRIPYNRRARPRVRYLSARSSC